MCIILFSKFADDFKYLGPSDITAKEEHQCWTTRNTKLLGVQKEDKSLYVF